MGNTTSSVLGGNNEEYDWRGIPIPKKEIATPNQEQIEEQIKQKIADLEKQVEALKSSLVDNEGAD